MIPSRLTAMLLASLVLLVGCGTPGPKGEPGTDGTQGSTGTAGEPGASWVSPRLYFTNGVPQYYLSNRRTVTAAENSVSFLPLPGLPMNVLADAPSDLVLLGQGTTAVGYTQAMQCHASFRFSVPNIDFGHTTVGQSIVMSYGTDNWWQNWSLLGAGPIPAGSTPVGVSARNSYGAGYCHWNPDGQPYDQNRLAALVFPRGRVQRVESTSPTFDLTANSAWTPYPGAAITFTLPQASKVLVLAQGNQQAVDGTCDGAYRLRINNQAQGDALYGQALVTSAAPQDGTHHWWKGFNVIQVYDAPAGGQTVDLQVRNTRGAAPSQCRWQAGTNPQFLDRARLIAIPLDGTELFAAESSTTAVTSPTGDVAWKAIPGAASTFTVPAQGADVLFIATGNHEARSGLCHGSYAFNVDSVRGGNPTYGQALQVNAAASAAFTNVLLLGSGSYSTAGNHTLALEVANSGGAATCVFNERARSTVVALVVPWR